MTPTLRESLPVLLLFLAAPGGCVPQGRYVEVRDALVREQAGHRDTTSQLQALGQRLGTAESERRRAAAELDARARRLEAQEKALAQLELDVAVAGGERAEAAELVEQLRGELERVAGHLRAFSEQRDALASALEAAQVKAEELHAAEVASAHRAMVVRDLALALHDPVATGELELVVIDGMPVLRVPMARLFAAPSAAAVAPDGDAVLAAVARVARVHPRASVHVTEAGSVVGKEAPEARLSRVSARLVEHGLPRTQVLVDVPNPDAQALAAALGEAPEPGRLELTFVADET